jgi:hypothetical protein
MREELDAELLKLDRDRTARSTPATRNKAHSAPSVPGVSNRPADAPNERSQTVRERLDQASRDYVRDVLGADKATVCGCSACTEAYGEREWQHPSGGPVTVGLNSSRRGRLRLNQSW